MFTHTPKTSIPENEKNFLLQFILSEIKKVVTKKQFDRWFFHLKINKITNDSITFETGSSFTRDWLCGNYMELLKNTISRILNSGMQISFITETERENKNQTYLSDLDLSHGHLTDEEISQDSVTNPLHEHYTFENFVIGPSNRLAHAAATAVSEAPGQAYNPLFIHGGAGLGKTHLLHAIYNALLAKGTVKTLCLSCERFVNHYISTIQSNNWDAFRQLYRNVDALLIDDIQYFKNSQGSREEFFHTFNALYNARKQIVITSDYPPESIHSLEDRLVSRFKWGLLCGLEQPSIETRSAIVEKKSVLWGLHLPHETALYIAENIPGNTRELEGAIARLGKEARITNNRITMDLAKKIIRDLTGRRKPISIEAVLEAVSKTFDVSVSQLQSKRRTKILTLPRQIAMHLSRKLTDIPLAEIGGYIGGRDHSTVIHADEKITKTLKDDKNLLFIIQKLESELQK